MSRIRSVIGVVAIAAAGGCYSTDASYPAPSYPAQPQTFSGPPGGAMDPGYGYQDPAYAQGYPDGSYADPNAVGTGDPALGADPQAPQQADATTMSSVTDAEIDATLQPYGSWTEDPDYGRVWRPDATVVGVDFTPYETCGSWVTTEYGWTYNCDWDWGWLPFHYGSWAWFDDGWGWVPGHQWSPAWVEWRHGGGYVGWRPIGPSHGRGPAIRDHRPLHDSAWRFASVNDFGRPHVRAHLFQNPSEGLRVTRPVVQPPRGDLAPVRAATLMHARMTNPTWTSTHPMSAYHAPTRSYQPPAVRSYRPPERTYQPPVRSYQPPVQTYQPPVRSYQPPVQTYQPPVRSYQPPVRTYQGPSHSAFGPPSHSSFSPSHSSSFSAPSHSSSSGGGGHSSGGSSHSSGGGHSGGGGHHR